MILHNISLFRKSMVFSFAFILLNVGLSAQTKTNDSIPSPNYKKVLKTTLNDFIQEKSNWKEQDTIYEYFSMFDVTQNQRFCYSNLGNIGSSHRMLDYKSTDFGFRFKDFPLSEYLVAKNNIPIYKPSSPYTQIYYVTGTGKLHFLGGLHAQQIKQFLLGLNFGLINSLGVYQRQKTNVSGASAYLNYSSKNQRYGITSAYFFNKISLQENGGLAIDSLFENNLEPFRAGMPINFQNAQNSYTEHHVSITQYYSPFNTKDSIRQLFNFGSLVHSLDFSKGKWIFSEEGIDSLSMPIIYRDSANTRDSSGYIKFSNDIEWRNDFLFIVKNNPMHLFTRWGLMHQFIEVSDSIVTKYDQSIQAHASFILQYDSTFSAQYYLNYILSGYGKNAYNHDFNVDYQIAKNQILRFGLKHRSNPVAYTQNIYHSNYNQWQNDFKQVVESSASLNYENKIVEAGVEGLIVSNYVYLNAVCQPEVYNEKINIFRAWSSIMLKWGILRSKTMLTYNSNNADSILMFPDFTARERLYFVFPMFHNGMIANAGVDAVYMPSYTAAFYNPSMFDFYLNPSKKIGNYVYVDVFVGFKVKRFNFFFKLINAPNGLLPYNYYSTPSYPLPDRQFKLGFSWRFYD